jgi:trigger factor
MAFSLRNDERLRQKLEASSALVEVGYQELPKATAPDITAIRVVVPLPKVTADEIGVRLLDEARAHAVVAPKPQGSEIVASDEVRMSYLLYKDGALVSAMFAHSMWFTLAYPPLTAFSGLVDEILNARVGQRLCIRTRIPQDFGAAELAGTEVVMVLVIEEARSVVLPSLHDNTFVASLGFGATLDEVMKSLAQQIMIEKEQGLPFEAIRSVFHAIAQATDVDVPEALVEKECKRRWKISEGDALVHLNVPQNEQDDAMSAFVRLPAVRADCTKMLRILAAMRAIAERDGIVATQEMADGFFEGLAIATGGTAQDVANELAGTPLGFLEATDTMLRYAIVDHVMKQASVTFA